MSTERRARSAGLRTYEDFEPALELVKMDGTDTILVHLPDFRKEQVRVQLEKTGNLKMSGERPLDGNKWSRFRKDARVPDNCEVNQIRAKLDNGILHITMPQMIAQATSADQAKKGKETPKIAAKQEKEKDDAREKTASAGIAEEQTKKATEPPASAARQKKASTGVVEKPTKEKTQDTRPHDSLAASARKEADGKRKEPERMQPSPQKIPQLEKAASTGAGTAEKEMGAKGDEKLPRVDKALRDRAKEAEKAKDGVKEREEGGKVETGKKGVAPMGNGRSEAEKRMVGEQKQEVGRRFMRLDQPKQLVVNVVVASLVVVGLGFYIAAKLRSPDKK